MWTGFGQHCKCSNHKEQSNFPITVATPLRLNYTGVWLSHGVAISFSHWVLNSHANRSHQLPEWFNLHNSTRQKNIGFLAFKMTGSLHLSNLWLVYYIIIHKIQRWTTYHFTWKFDISNELVTSGHVLVGKKKVKPYSFKHRGRWNGKEVPRKDLSCKIM